MPWYWETTREDGTQIDAEGELGWQEVLHHHDVCDGQDCLDQESHAEGSPSRLTSLAVDTGVDRIEVTIGPGERLAFARRVHMRYGYQCCVVGKRYATHAMATAHIGSEGTSSVPDSGDYNFIDQHGKVTTSNDFHSA